MFLFYYLRSCYWSYKTFFAPFKVASFDNSRNNHPSLIFEIMRYFSNKVYSRVEAFVEAKGPKTQSLIAWQRKFYFIRPPYHFSILIGNAALFV